MNNFFWSHRAPQAFYDQVNYGLLYNWYAAAQPQSIKYGYLYNWYAAIDVREIANTGWHVPSAAEFTTLGSYLGGTSVAGGKLKETGLTYWNSPNTNATNESKFNGRAASSRYNVNGYFNSLGINLDMWTTTTGFPAAKFYRLQYNTSQLLASSTYAEPGLCVRLIKDSTTLSHGETGTYVGNDGRVYKTICIGTQEWLSENLMETKYRDGSSIPEVTDNATWAGLTTGARCSYNNTETNAVVNTEIANTGWHVSTRTEWLNLLSYVGGDSIAAAKLKEVGAFIQETGNETNEYGFYCRPSGWRESNGSFSALGGAFRGWGYNGVLDYRFFYMVNNSDIVTNSTSLRTYGFSVRLIKDSTTLSHGQSGTYTGNDGKVYRTICIGTQEWLADNLLESRYRDGSLIPIVEDNTAWSNLTTGACCYYNNDPNNG